MRVAALVMAACVVLTGCSTSSGSPLIPDKSLYLTSTTTVSYSAIATAAVVLAAIYIVYDPLAPNWEIEESQLNNDTYRFSLKMKRYHTGGSGESMQIFKRRAGTLQHEHGFAGYQILEYTEGIESQTIGARRVAEGTIKLVQRQEADSFLQNGRY